MQIATIFIRAALVAAALCAVLLAQSALAEGEAVPLFSKRQFSGNYLAVEEFSITHYQYETHRDPYFYSADVEPNWAHLSEFRFTLGILKSLYWDNNFHMSFDDAKKQIRHAGWEYVIGLRVTTWLDVVKYHHSQHSFDETLDGRFPNTDALGVRVYFIK